MVRRGDVGFSGSGAYPRKGAVGFNLVEVLAGGVSPHSSEVAAVPVGGGGAWPGFETTRRAKLAARTASGRAAAHGHIEQPGTPVGPQAALRNWEVLRPTARSAGNAIL